jgi:hypothetical protein
MPFVHYLPFIAILSVAAIVVLFLVGRWRTRSRPPGARWASFGCGLAIFLAVVAVLFGIFMFVALGMGAVCCY